MAKVWYAYEGPEPTASNPNFKNPKCEMPVDDCVRQLGLSRNNFRNSLKHGMPIFPDPLRIGTAGGYKHVVIEIKIKEAESSGWKSGFYILEKRPDQVTKVLGKPNDPL